MYFTFDCPACGEQNEAPIRVHSRGSHGNFYEPPEGPEWEFEEASVTCECGETITTNWLEEKYQDDIIKQIDEYDNTPDPHDDY